MVSIQLQEREAHHAAEVLWKDLHLVEGEMEVREFGQGSEVAGQPLQSVLGHVQDCEVFEIYDAL